MRAGLASGFRFFANRHGHGASALTRHEKKREADCDEIFSQSYKDAAHLQINDETSSNFVTGERACDSADCAANRADHD